MVELGHIDTMTEISTFASHIALPRQGHLDALLHLFAYFGRKHNARIIFDPTCPDIDMTVFKGCDLKHFYDNLREAIPPNAPDQKGEGSRLTFTS